MIIERLQQRLESAHQVTVGTAAAPDFLAFLMDLVMSLLGGCMPGSSANDIVSLCKNRPVIARLSIRQGLRKQGIQPTNAIVETLMTASKTATADDYNQIHAMGDVR